MASLPFKSSFINIGCIRSAFDNVVSPVFKDAKNGEYKLISFYAKKARGYMASWLIKNQINKEKDISSFSEEGYKFSIEDSQYGSPVFLRG